MRDIKPINGRVFVERDPEEKELMGFAVGDRAKVKSLMGTVVVSDTDIVAAGDRIHLPHQRAKTLDCVVDGRELTCVTEADLFSVEKDGVLRPINRYVKVLKCEEDDIRNSDNSILLYMTEEYKEYTNWVEIIDVAHDCRNAATEDVGLMLVAPENDDRLQRNGRTKEYFVHEDLIQFVTGE